MKLEALKGVIQKANPEIMTKKYGCWIGYDLFTHKGERIHSAEDLIFATGSDDEIFTIDFPQGFKDAYIVLGRDIEFSDILLAIERNNVEVKLSLYGDSVTIQHYDEKGYETHCYYKLDNPLVRQRESTIDFLHSILCK